MLGVVLTALRRGGSAFSAAWSSPRGEEDAKEAFRTVEWQSSGRELLGAPAVPQPSAARRQRVPGPGLGQAPACSSGAQKHLAGIGMPLFFSFE